MHGSGENGTPKPDKICNAKGSYVVSLCFSTIDDPRKESFRSVQADQLSFCIIKTIATKFKQSEVSTHNEHVTCEKLEEQGEVSEDPPSYNGQKQKNGRRKIPGCCWPTIASNDGFVLQGHRTPVLLFIYNPPGHPVAIEETQWERSRLSKERFTCSSLYTGQRPTGNSQQPSRGARHVVSFLETGQRHLRNPVLVVPGRWALPRTCGYYWSRGEKFTMPPWLEGLGTQAVYGTDTDHKLLHTRAILDTRWS
ncbi:uncharacterized protein NECHADRAFT_87370 [Fusarium vanettenii 77-13-4]|uniref:Uncharacterized protein n=1 Tax=Fusarium vanettenii (strain ATCC MYA-4622 / CBS 123669 / FGSC 9596 / NRRL 45880 / 77-13-4) TaxID=660122 RepID=C7ZE31_FUSV7|nr:uncharacterized protein NECHADRAFT_87370 [Fusarium vanettenii 77-13-4]EEU37534.1 predicted protein [Fusarium vanettenii 77-13-4]